MVANRVLLIDAFNLIRRIFEARSDPDGHIDDLLETCSRSVSRALRQHQPSHACVVFDGHDTTWRHLLFDQYKQGRKPTPLVLLENLPRFKSAFQALGVLSLNIESYEADDIIATLATGIGDSQFEAIILSTDKSFLQLLSDSIRVFNHFDQVELTRETVLRKYQVEVEQLIDFWALAGDASNNIKGVPKVGKKTAVALIKQYGTLDAILLADAEDKSVARVRQHLELVRRCHLLVTLKTDVRLGINLKSLRLNQRLIRKVR